MDIDGLLAEADPARDISIPGHDSPAAGRALGRITMPTPKPPQRRLPGQARRLTMVAAASAGIAAGLVIALVMASGAPVGSRPAPQVGSRPAPASFGPADTAAGVLHNAALAALHMPAHTPRPDQFVYMKSYTTDTTRSGGPGVIQEWRSVSGTRFGLIKGGWRMPAGGEQLSACVNGRIKQAPRGPKYIGVSHCVQAASAGYLPDLPTGDPAMLEHYLEKTFQIHFYSPDDKAGPLINLIDMLTTSYYLTPAQRAALYNLLAQAPGLKMVRHVRNQLGSAGVGIRTTSLNKGSYETIIFNPRTYAPLGVIWQQPPGQKLAGITNGGRVLLEQAIVNKAGQTP